MLKRSFFFVVDVQVDGCVVDFVLSLGCLIVLRDCVSLLDTVFNFLLYMLSFYNKTITMINTHFYSISCQRIPHTRQYC